MKVNIKKIIDHDIVFSDTSNSADVDLTNNKILKTRKQKIKCLEPREMFSQKGFVDTGNAKLISIKKACKTFCDGDTCDRCGRRIPKYKESTLCDKCTEDLFSTDPKNVWDKNKKTINQLEKDRVWFLS